VTTNAYDTILSFISYWFHDKGHKVDFCKKPVYYYSIRRNNKHSSPPPSHRFKKETRNEKESLFSFDLMGIFIRQTKEYKENS